jgi:multicomponent K+:H+ antiporter subunit E
MRTHMMWLPHPLLSLFLLFLWLLLTDSLSPGQILLGAVLGLLIPLLTSRFWPEMARIRRPFVALKLFALLVYDIIVANFVVARVVLGPSDAIEPAFVRIPLDLEGDFAVTLLASVVSLTPGTLSASLDAGRRHLLVHALSERDPRALARRIKERYEAPIKEIFLC